VQLAAQIQWKQEPQNGQSGSSDQTSGCEIGLSQLSTQCSISNNVIYLNDLSAALTIPINVNATGRLICINLITIVARYRQTWRTWQPSAAASRFWQSE